MTVNDLLEQHSYSSSSKIEVRLLPPGESERAGYVLIEGNRSALRFLGELLLAISEQSGATDDLQLHPSGAGSLHFQSNSDIGFYIRMSGNDGELPGRD